MAGASARSTTASCELLQWDSEHFGFPVAQVRGSTLDDASAESIDEWCSKFGVRCLYFLADADAQETARAAEAHGYRPVDVRLTLRHELDGLSDRGEPVAIRDALPGDIPALRELAIGIHHDSRFYYDPGFARERCDALYATWIEGAVRDPSRLALVAEIDGAVAGYQVIGAARDAEVARLEMLGVSERHRRIGAGSSLLVAGLKRARSHGASAAETATQGRNEPSLRVHLAVGFSTVRREIWHHKWFER